MENKKEIFKLLIKEFHELKPPRIIKRDYQLPDCYAAAISGPPASPLSLSSRSPSLIAITGPRRCGKTYFILQLIEHFCCNSNSPVPRSHLIYINFEDDRLLPVCLPDLAAISDAYFELYPDNRDKELMAFFDAIDLIKGWEFFLQRLLDRENIRLFITGSSSKFCARSLPSALSSRTLELAISPLSFKEFLAFKGVDITPDFAYSNIRFKVINLLEEYITFGGYPEVVLADRSLKLQILKNHYDMLIYKELAEEFSIRNVVLLKELLKSLILHIDSTFSINSYFLSVQPKLHISRETILDYVSHLEEKGLIGLVPIFSDSPKAQQVNPKKVYSFDNGLRNTVSFPLPLYKEKLVKNLIYQKLRRSGTEVFYWKKRGEVDFVARENGKLWGIIVSYGRELRSEDARSLLEFQSAMGRRDVNMTIITQDTEKMEKGIRFSPLWKWLLASD